MTSIRKSVATVAVAGMLVGGGMAAPAYAQVEQDGLVNVSIGDVTILKNVNVAANIVAAVCANLDLAAAVVAVVAVVAIQEVDDTGGEFFDCNARGRQDVTVTNNQSC